VLRLKMLCWLAQLRGENKDFLWARGVTSFVKKLVQRALLRPWGVEGGSGGAVGQDKSVIFCRHKLSGGIQRNVLAGINV